MMVSPVVFTVCLWFCACVSSCVFVNSDPLHQWLSLVWHQPGLRAMLSYLVSKSFQLCHWCPLKCLTLLERKKESCGSLSLEIEIPRVYNSIHALWLGPIVARNKGTPIAETGVVKQASWKIPFVFWPFEKQGEPGESDSATGREPGVELIIPSKNLARTAGSA